MAAPFQLHKPLISSESQARGLRLLSGALEEMVEGVSITCPDTNRFLYVNSAWQRIYGWPAANVLGQLPQLLNRPDEDEIRIQQIVEASRNEGWQGQLVNRDRDGQEFIIHLRTRPIAMDRRPSGLDGHFLAHRRRPPTRQPMAANVRGTLGIPRRPNAA